MYLDASGREFYLPAYLTVALNGRNINHYRHAVLLLDVYPEEDDENMRKHLISRLSKIKGEKKQVCIEFLEYVHSRFSDEKRVLNDLACDANKLLHDKFWAKKGA